jgi:hypothetical protein
MKLFKSASLALLLSAAGSAFAFDDKRQGFILGFGAGFHNLRENFHSNGSSVSSKSEGGIATSFKIGGGITDQVALYYVRNASWFSAPYFNGVRTKDAVYTIGLSGIGASYFLSPTAPSGYFLASIGIGDISAPFEENTRADTGGALMFGGGYEFTKNLMIEGTLLTTNIENPDLVPPVTLKSSSLQVTINYLFY